MVFAFQSAPPAHKGLPPNEFIALTDVLTPINHRHIARNLGRKPVSVNTTSTISRCQGDNISRSFRVLNGDCPETEPIQLSLQVPVLNLPELHTLVLGLQQIAQCREAPSCFGGTAHAHDLRKSGLFCVVP
jgi:hypothetical protein